MKYEHGQDSIEIPCGSTLRIDDGVGVTLEVRQGDLWLTEEGGREDHFLGPGQSFRISRRGTTLVHAFQPSVVLVSAALPRNWAQSIGLRLRRACAALRTDATGSGHARAPVLRTPVAGRS